MTEFKIEYNQDLDKLRSVYDYYNKFEFLVGKELTFTVAPGRCKDIQDVKKKIMRMVVGRVKRSQPVAFMLTRENHENGWPHIHGIGWWPKDRDNSLTLSEGRLYVEEHQPGMKYASRGYQFSELGRSKIYDLRKEVYTVTKDDMEETWSDWLEYICKDQKVQWREGNVIVRSNIDISNFFSKVKVETYID